MRWELPTTPSPGDNPRARCPKSVFKVPVIRGRLRTSLKPPAVREPPNATVAQEQPRTIKRAYRSESIRGQPLPELRPPLASAAAPHRDRHRPALTDDDHQTLAARDGCVDEIARQHGVMLGRERDNDGRIFRTLRLMDRRRIGGNHSVEFAKRIFDLAPVEAGDEETFNLVDAQNGSEVAIEDVAIIIVLGLHDLVAGRENRPEFLDLRGRIGIEGFLQIGIERAGAEGKIGRASCRERVCSTV